MIVEATRASRVESRHRGRAVAVDAAGRIVAAFGDVAAPVFPRSSYKLLQAIPLIESGAADALGLEKAALALACASHNGEAAHVGLAAQWLARMGLREDDLACGPQTPRDAEAANTLIRSGRGPGRLHNNCSGKHAGFLSVARAMEAPIEGYQRPDHPVQRRVRAAIGEMAGVDLTDAPCGVDGCSAPALAMPFAALARAFAQVADPSGLTPTRAAAVRRLRAAVAAHPWHVAGTGRACTLLMTAADGRAIVKTGAEGVFTAAVPGLRLGVAVKIDDGATRAAECAIATILVGLGVVDDADQRVRRIMSAPIRSFNNELVGAVRASAGFSVFVGALRQAAKQVGTT